MYIGGEDKSTGAVRTENGGEWRKRIGASVKRQVADISGKKKFLVTSITNSAKAKGLDLTDG